MGMLVVAAAGNENDKNGTRYPQDLNCNVEYPAMHPEVVGVAAIGNLETVNPLLPYDVEELFYGSARGWITAGRGGSVPGSIWVPAVSMAAPGVIERHMTEIHTYQDLSSVDYFWSEQITGTSFAAPVVSGAAALFREWMNSFPLPWANDARYLRAMVLVMGDGTGARYTGPGSAAGTSQLYGAGKFKPHLLDELETPAGWNMFAIGVLEGWTLQFPQPPLDSSTTQWKWAIYIAEPDLTQVPHILVTVKDTCDNNRVIAADWSLSTEKYISIETPVVHEGVCPMVELYGYSVSATNIPFTYNVGYWHSGDPGDH